MKKRMMVSVGVSAAMVAPWFAAAQSAEEGIRQLWNTQFFQKRPAGKKQAAAPKSVVYKPAGEAKAASPASQNVTDTLLGLTLWRLRRPRPADDPNSRLLVIEEETKPGSGAEYVPERVEADSALAEGDRVRLTVEVPRTGYLYVIDREQYADGSSSAPYLIYPNHKTRPGDNAVAAGRVIEIPDQRDTPSYFRLRRGQANQTAEVLTMLITNQPLADLNITSRPLKLEESQFAEWEKKYGVQAERFELAGGEGTVYSGAEKEAGAGGETRLTQDDPMPQTLYRVPGPAERPILLSVPVKIKKQ